MNDKKIVEVRPSPVPAYQGDVGWRVGGGKVPEDAKPVPAEGGLLILAHSETGHHHAIAVADATPGVVLFAVPGDVRTMWLKVPKGGHADVVHHRDWDTHVTHRLLAEDDKDTVFDVRRGRAATPEGWKVVVD